MKKGYVLKLMITSDDKETTEFKGYDDSAVAFRKFHECFNVAGGGPKKIIAHLYDENLVVVKRETWIAEEEGE